VIELNSWVSRFAFDREVEAMRPGLSRAGYAARRFASGIGLLGQLESNIFFWATKAC
jgi:hypothetical protein